MGRPKGSKSKPLLTPENILETTDNQKDENDNSLAISPPIKPIKIRSLKPRNSKKSKNMQIYTDLVGKPIEMLPPSKLPQKKVVLQRYLALRNEFPKGKIGDLVSILYTEIVTGIWVPARINTEPVKLCKQLIQNIILKFNKFKSSPCSTNKLNQP